MSSSTDSGDGTDRPVALASPPAPISPIAMRDVLGQYPTGVAVITAIADDGEALAMVVGTFTSVSLTPPLIAFLPTKGSYVFGRIRTARGFVVNILAHDQEALCRELARPVPDKLGTVDWTPSATIGAPVLPNVLAHVECAFHDVLDAGDHYIVLGDILHLETKRQESPLIFLQGGFGGFVPPAFLHATDQDLARAVSSAQRFQHDIEDIADWLDAPIDVFARIGHDAALVATTGFDGDHSGEYLGARYPVILPFGEHFVALGGDETQWLSRAQSMAPEDVEHFRARLELIRRQEWTFTLSDPILSAGLFDAVHDYADRPLPASYRRIAMSAAEARPTYPAQPPADEDIAAISLLLAPVRAADGTARYVVRARLAGRPMSGAELKAVGMSLVAQCDRIAKTLKLI